MAKTDYEVPDNHSERMMTMIGLDTSIPESTLPASLKQRYIEMRVTADRIGMPISDIHLWCIVHSVRLEEMPSMPDPTIAELFRSKKISVGEKLLCTVGRKTDIPGVLIGIDVDDRAIVQLESGDERKFTSDKVKITGEQGSAL